MSGEFSGHEPSEERQKPTIEEVLEAKRWLKEAEETGRPFDAVAAEKQAIVIQGAADAMREGKELGLVSDEEGISIDISATERLADQERLTVLKKQLLDISKDHPGTFDDETEAEVMQVLDEIRTIYERHPDLKPGEIA